MRFYRWQPLCCTTSTLFTITMCFGTGGSCRSLPRLASAAQLHSSGHSRSGRRSCSTGSPSGYGSSSVEESSFSRRKTTTCDEARRTWCRQSVERSEPCLQLLGQSSSCFPEVPQKQKLTIMPRSSCQVFYTHSCFKRCGTLSEIGASFAMTACLPDLVSRPRYLDDLLLCLLCEPLSVHMELAAMTYLRCSLRVRF